MGTPVPGSQVATPAAVTSECLWLNLQTAYDLELERLEGRLETEVEVLARAW